jgi:hypothetical protein
MISRASEKVKRPTITDDKMEKDKSLSVARQPICGDHDTIIENMSSKGADIEEEDESERESKIFSVRAKDSEVRRPPLLTSLNDTKYRYVLNQVLGIGVLLSGRKVTGLEDIGYEADLIILRRYAQRNGIAAAENRVAVAQLLCPMKQYL